MAYRASDIRHIVTSRLHEDEAHLKSVFNQPGKIRCCWLDDLLPLEILNAALGGLPEPGGMVRRQSLKECKYVSAALDQLGEATRNLMAAFSGQQIAEAVTGLMGGSRLHADPRLYNGGITKMMPGDFMCPPSTIPTIMTVRSAARWCFCIICLLSGGKITAALWNYGTMISSRRQGRSVIKATGW